jgi:hypothetical protein
MRITIVAIALVWTVASSTFLVHPSPTITVSGISTGFEASEGYTVGNLDDQMVGNMLSCREAGKWKLTSSTSVLRLFDRLWVLMTPKPEA